jgi:hypothetical protein
MIFVGSSDSKYVTNGILLNVCPDQLATRAVGGISYAPEAMVPPGEPVSVEEFVMEEDDITQRDLWSDPNHLPPGPTHAVSVGLGAKELREQHEELLQHFSPPPVVVSDGSAAASPHISSEDSDSGFQIPDPEDSGVAEAVTGDGFRIVDDDTPMRTLPQLPFYEHVPVSNRLSETAEWMTEVDKHMLAVEDHQARCWEQFRELINERGESRFAAIERKRYEKCSLAPENDVVVAAVLVVWSDTRIPTVKVARKDDWPIAHSGVALRELFKAGLAHSEVVVLLEWDNVCAALLEGQDMDRKNLDPAISVI